MNKEEALAKLCQYSTCNYKEQIWAPEAKELLEYWSGVERQIKQLQQENKELIEILKTIRHDINFVELCDGYLIEDKLNELEGKNE